MNKACWNNLERHGFLPDDQVVLGDSSGDGFVVGHVERDGRRIRVSRGKFLAIFDSPRRCMAQGSRW